MKDESTSGGSETRKLTSEDENAIDAAATEYATYADNENNDYSYSQDEHHTFTQGANWGIKYARNVQSSVQSPDSFGFRGGVLTEFEGYMEQCVDAIRNTGTTLESFAHLRDLLDHYERLKSPSLVNDSPALVMADLLGALKEVELHIGPYKWCNINEYVECKRIIHDAILKAEQPDSQAPKEVRNS